MKGYFRQWGLAACLVLGALASVAGPAVGAAPTPDFLPKAPRVPWIKDKPWQEILEQARSNDQPIIIDFTAHWCGPCRLLDVMVFNEKAVIAELAEVVTFQVDVDKPEYASLKESFAVELLPTVVWCDTAGDEIDRFTGYRSSGEFLEIVRSWRGNRTIDRMLADRQDVSPEDPDVLLDLARRHAERGQDHEAEVLYRRLMNLRHKADTRTVARGMLGLAELEDKAGYGDRSDRLVSQAVALYAVDDPSAEVLACRTEGLLEIALSQASRGDTLGALEIYRTMVQLDDQDVLGLDGFARTAVEAGVELEEGTYCALRAMVLSGNDASIIGTLAETYYLRGMYSKAIRWIILSIERDPDSAYYRDRLTAFEAAQAGDPAGRSRSAR